MRSEARRIGIATAALACALAVVVLLAFGRNALLDFADQRAADEAAAAAAAASVGVQGLDPGATLAAEPDSIDGEYALFSDRVVKLFRTDEATIEACASAQAALFSVVPEGVNRYLMIAPTRASFEPSLAAQTQDEFAAIDQVYASMPAEVTCIDVASVLSEHAQDYLYYRTELALTSEGAYWASRALIDACGAAGIDISEYRCDDRRTFRGTFATLWNLDTPDDLVETYVHDDLTNKALITVRTDDGALVDTYEALAIASSRGGNYAALGTDVAQAVIEGDGGNDRVIMVVGTSDARALSTWLIASFDRIVYVSQDWTTLDATQFQALFSEYGVTDFLIFESADDLSLGNGNSSLLELAGRE